MLRAPICASSPTVTRYEIHIPGPEGNRVERVHGDNWLDALRRGLSAAGLPAPNRNLGVTFGEGGAVDITDSDAGRSYKVVPVADAQPMTARSRTGPMALPIEDEVDDPFADDDSVEPGLPVVPPVQATPPPSTSRRAGRLSPMAWGPYRRQIRSATNAPADPGAIEDFDDRPPDTGELRRGGRGPADSVESPATDLGDPLLADVAALDRFEGGAVEASAFLLDRAMHHVPCAAGSVLLIHSRERCLYFAAVRGSKAELLADQRVPLEVGLVGHCVRTRRSINVAEPARDPRFARTIADKVGYLPSSIVCLPIVAGRKTFGVLELLDRLGEETFSEAEEASLRRASRKLGALIARRMGL